MQHAMPLYLLDPARAISTGNQHGTYKISCAASDLRPAGGGVILRVLNSEVCLQPSFATARRAATNRDLTIDIVT